MRTIDFTVSEHNSVESIVFIFYQFVRFNKLLDLTKRRIVSMDFYWCFLHVRLDNLTIIICLEDAKMIYIDRIIFIYHVKGVDHMGKVNIRYSSNDCSSVK